MTETLRQKQSRFVRDLARLIDFAYAQGYELTGGELYRTSNQAALNAAAGRGIANSLHTQRLAIDLMLFRNGEFLTASIDHTPLGEFWESLGPDYCWGGRFKRADGNHYSITHDGVR